MTNNAAQRLFRALPSMDSVLAALEKAESVTVAALPRPLLRDCVEEFLEDCRRAIRAGEIREPEELSLPALLPRIARHAGRASRPHFRRVLNATGVVIHTNLGRSLLAKEAADAAHEAALHYSNLEFDLEAGKRGTRYSHVESLICKLTGAEAALVVNNNAAAVLLMLDTLCKGREVLVSRGQLVEIGGSFRIPEVMEKSDCILREVGATNRTHPKDYTAALNEQTAALLKVHTSNFRISGFTCEVSREELAAIARKHSLPLLEDLGSGNFFDFARAHSQSVLPHGQSNAQAAPSSLAALFGEPTAAQAVAGGADVVTFSGDKVLGGPQAGIIAGRAEYIERIKKNPLNRALRIDKMTLAALEATLRLYLDPELARQRVPTLRMLCMTEKELRDKARKLARILKTHLTAGVEPAAQRGSTGTGKNGGEAVKGYGVTLCPGVSLAGGGAFPECTLPTRLVRLSLDGSVHSIRPDQLREALLHTDLPLVARVEDNALCLDPRTLDDQEFTLAAEALAQALRALEQPDG